MEEITKEILLHLIITTRYYEGKDKWRVPLCDENRQIGVSFLMRFFIKIGLTVLMCIYLVILSHLVLFKTLTIPEIISHFTFTYEGETWNHNNFTPFKTIFFYLYLADVNPNIRIDNLIGNILGFVPFGFILPLLSKRCFNVIRVAGSTLSLSLTYELIQLIFKFGSFDVDDLILNTFGGIVGYLLLKLLLLFLTGKQGLERIITNR